MIDSTNEQQPAAGATSPLADALDQNKLATEEVQKAADDLAVVHAVLDTKVTRGADDEDVKRAVAQTSELEQRLDESVKKLEQVNEVLEREMGRATDGPGKAP